MEANPRSASPLPIIVKTETLGECVTCTQVTKSIKDVFTQKVPLLSHHVLTRGCCKHSMRIDHANYRQKVKWYFECFYCDYRSFYQQEIEQHVSKKHSVMCDVGGRNVDINDVSCKHTDVTIPQVANGAEQAEQQAELSESVPATLSLSLASLNTPEKTPTTKPESVYSNLVARKIKLGAAHTPTSTASSYIINSTSTSAITCSTHTSTSNTISNTTSSASSNAPSTPNAKSLILLVPGTDPKEGTRRIEGPVTLMSPNNPVYLAGKSTEKSPKSSEYTMNPKSSSIISFSEIAKLSDTAKLLSLTTSNSEVSKSRVKVSVLPESSSKTSTAGAGTRKTSEKKTSTHPVKKGPPVKRERPMKRERPTKKERKNIHNAPVAVDTASKVNTSFSSSLNLPSSSNSREEISKPTRQPPVPEIPLASPTLNLYQFSDMLGLQKIKDSPEAGHTQKISEAQLGNVNNKPSSPYQRMYKTTALKRFSRRGLKLTDEYSKASDITKTVKRNKHKAIVINLDKTAKDSGAESSSSSPMSAMTSTTCLWKTSDSFLHQTVPIISSTPQLVASNTALTTSIINPTEISKPFNQTSSRTTSNSADSLQELRDAEKMAMATSPSQEKDLSPKLTVKIDKFLTPHPKKAKQQVAKKSTGGVKIDSLHRPHDEGELQRYTLYAFKSTGGAQTPTTTCDDGSSWKAVRDAREQQDKLAAIKSMFSVTKTSQPDVEGSSLGTSLTLPLPHPDFAKYPQTPIKVAADKLEPLHISTDMPSRTIASCPESESPIDSKADINPWPSPLDPLSPPFKSPPSTEGTKATESDSKVGVNKFMNKTPLLTIGTSIDSPPSPARSSSTKRLAREKAEYALQALDSLVNTSHQQENVSPHILDLSPERVYHSVKYIHDRRCKSVKYFCKHKPVELMTEDPISSNDAGEGTDDPDGDGVWPGPVLSDEDTSSPAAAEEVEEALSDHSDSTPPLHPRWSCQSGCKYHTSSESPNSLSKKRPMYSSEVSVEVKHKKLPD